MTKKIVLEEAIGRVTELSGADRPTAWNVAHCLIDSSLTPRDRDALMASLHEMWEECREVWEEGGCDGCRRVLALMGVSV